MEGDRSFHADSAFYEAALSYGPITDPRPIFLLTNAYIVAHQQEHGISFFERLLKRYENRMTDDNDIVRLNLIMPGLQDHPEAFFGYLAPRDHIIARVGDHMSGIWREDVTGMEPGGLDALTSVEYGRFLELYLGLAAGQVEDALRRMIDGGDNELALQFAVAAERRYEDNLGIIQLKQEAGDNLRSAAQFFDPFKFVVYTEMIGKEHGSIPRAPVR